LVSARPIGLDVELARDGQERLAAEEILRGIDLALRRARQVGVIRGRDPGKDAGTLRVTSSDDRRIDPEKPVPVEKRWIALARQCRSRVAVATTLVCRRRCAASRRYSKVWGFRWIG